MKKIFFPYFPVLFDLSPLLIFALYLPFFATIRACVWLFIVTGTPRLLHIPSAFIILTVRGTIYPVFFVRVFVVDGITVLLNFFLNHRKKFLGAIFRKVQCFSGYCITFFFNLVFFLCIFAFNVVYFRASQKCEKKLSIFSVHFCVKFSASWGYCTVQFVVKILVGLRYLHFCAFSRPIHCFLASICH